MSLFRRLLYGLRRARYPGGLEYWEKRYADGGCSGSGSTGPLAAYKADWLNNFVRQKVVHSVAELGCGDGQQLQLAHYPDYLGLDVAPSAIRRCQALFAGDSAKRFAVYDPFDFDPASAAADLVLSLEVIFHLTEEAVYQQYMQHLFGLARHWVVVFSSNEADHTGGQFPHFRPRHFTSDVPQGWILEEHVPNPHRDISISDFFVFKRSEQAC